MKKTKVKIGIVGCGAIGSEIAKYCERKLSSVCQVAYISDVDEKTGKRLLGKLRKKPRFVDNDKLIKESDFVIEAASSKISWQIARKSLLRNKSVLIMSVGGLINAQGLEGILSRTRGNLYIPSGAVSGIDSVLGAKIGKVKKASLITRKPPRGLKGAPYFKKSRIDIDKIKKETLVFSGTAREAMKYFPKNINVSATLSLAGIGPNNTKVKIYTSPTYKKNSHEITVEGASGRITTKTENVPSPANPKTSYLAILSALALLDKIFKRIKIGT